MRRLEQLEFSNSYARLPESFFSRVRPTPLQRSHLISFNAQAAALLDLDPDEARRPEFTRYFSGAELLPASEPVAALYAGHQFGHYVPQLGDGRAILLGEVRNRRGERWEVQLKGAGVTPYSRRGDGRAVLRSTIREYLCGEAMHGLGIPSTRALCMFASDEEVWREEVEQGALLVRLAPSHVRFGSFEVHYYRRQFDHLRRLADYVIEHHYPEFGAHSDEERYLELFRAVVQRTARLIAQWQAVGFAHGVMNTDNMSILGLTLDYGPFAFLDTFEPGLVCNHSDHAGRYAFDRQPAIAHWNLSCLGQALLPLLGGPVEAAVERANAVLDSFVPLFEDHYRQLMANKLGLRELRPADDGMWQNLLQLLAANQVDYTNFFRALSRFDATEDSSVAAVRDQFVDRAAFEHWVTVYRRHLMAEGRNAAERHQAMLRTNPKYILRNYLAEQAIRRAADGDPGEIQCLLQILQTPYDEQDEFAEYALPPPQWGRHLVISCSS